MTLFLAAFAVVLFLSLAWFALQLLQQNGRLLVRLEALEQAVDELAERPPAAHTPDRSLAKSRIKRDGLDIGTAAPDFVLPRLGGGDLSLKGFRGRPLLLVFSDPQCAPCDRLAPELERRSRMSDVQVLMVSRGDAAANDAKRRAYQLSFPIVLQRQWEISKLYAMFATPIAYLIDEDGVIAAPVAKGPDAILALLSHAAVTPATA